MKRVIIIFIILVIAIGLGLFMHADPGYVLIAYKNWSIETTLWIMILVFLLLFVLVFFCSALLRSGGKMPGRIKLWLMQKNAKKNRHLTNRGLCAWAEGKWRQAEKLLIKATKNSEEPLINYLVAARAAQELNKFDQRDSYLRKAHGSAPGVEIAVGLTQARLQLMANQLELALATLKHLRQLVPTHPYIMRLLQEVYLKLNDWQSLLTLLPELHQYKVLSRRDMFKLEHQVYLQQLTANQQDFNELNKLWQEMPKELQNDGELLIIYCHGLMQNNQKILAEKLLRNALQKKWDEKLVECYGLLALDRSEKQLAVTEAWLKNHPHSAALLLCLARLCKQQHLWGKAQNYLDRSLSEQPTAAVYYELGDLMEQLGKRSEALDYYRQGLLVD